MIISKMVDIYAVYYPIVLSFIWASGTFLSRWKDKRRARGLNDREKISIVISAYNEEETIEEVLLSLRNLNYPALEIFHRAVYHCQLYADNSLKSYGYGQAIPPY